MRMIFGLVLLAGLALAGGAVYMAKNYIGQYQTALAKERAERQKMVKTIPVFVVERSLKYGESLTSEDVRQVSWPEDAIPEGAFTADNILFQEGETRPRYVLRAMEKDEAVLAIKVTEPGEEAGLTSRIERGMRAFAIEVDVASGVSGFLRPGDRVDVYWTGRIQGGGNQDRNEVTKLIEAGVQLIAIDQTATGDVYGATVARTVTVSARPDRVGALAQAQATGRLSLSLVGADDDTIAEAVEVNQKSLLGLPEEKVAVVEEEVKTCSVRKRVGTEVVIEDIPCRD
ncbi:MAG: Flp pilus assembly protein CpaB [Paracoccaceae bacterium]